MLVKLTRLVAGGAIAAISLAVPAMAQESGADLLSLDRSALNGEVRTRYDEAVALTGDPAVAAVDGSRFTWASQAKAQCAIALGFLKSGTKDPVSIGKCGDAAMRMRAAVGGPVATAAPEPAPLPDACAQPIAGIVFFDFDSALVPESSSQTLASVVEYTKVCAWKRLVVTGHTDRSGSDGYNNALSVRRAQAVAAQLGAIGVPAGVLEVSGRGEAEPKVQTLDGERNPTNRRVEITVQ